MTMLYSPSRDSFYLQGVHYSSVEELPEDVLEVSQDQFKLLSEGRAAGKLIVLSGSGELSLVARPRSQESLWNDIDATADFARRLVVGDPTRAEEYRAAARDALAYRVAGYPANEVPRTVSAWAIGGRTAQDAADEILAADQKYSDAICTIREKRLAAKEAVREACAGNNLSLAGQLADAAIAEIMAAAEAIGNTRGE